MQMHIKLLLALSIQMIPFSRKTYIMLTVLWAFFILVLCIIPGRDLPSSNLWQIDKVFHFLFYLILTYLFICIFEGYLSILKILGVFVLCCVYGISIECIQGAFLADRFFDVWDIVANSSGAFIAGFYHLIRYQIAFRKN